MRPILTPNPRTAEQNRRLWWLAGQLGIDREAMGEVVLSLTEGRTRHTSELSYMEARELIEFLQQTLDPKGLGTFTSKSTDMMPDGHPDRKQLDCKRKGVIKAIFRWFELRGKQPTMEYVKGVACRAAGKDRFNDISIGELTRIYAEFCKKQRTVAAMMPEDFTVSMN